jgi:GNAT superfamily N-acetyltransferase
MTVPRENDTASSPIAMPAFEPMHLPGALGLSQEVAWPYRLEDWQFALATGHGLVFERAGDVFGTAMWWSYGQSFATAGMIIVAPAMQGRGYGARLVDGVLEATNGRNVLLNSTEDGLPLYRRRGFEAFGHVVQHRGMLRVVIKPSARDDTCPATFSDFEAIAALDERASGMPRAALLASLKDVGDVRVINRGGEISGYAIARRFGLGYVVGPVVAESEEDARLLILSHLSVLCGHIVRIDVHAEDGLGDWLTRLGLEPVSRVTAMVRGQRPLRDGMTRIYALANQSMG